MPHRTATVVVHGKTSVLHHSIITGWGTCLYVHVSCILITVQCIYTALAIIVPVLFLEFVSNFK